MAELRAAEDGTWVRIEGDRGDHGHAAVADALAALEREGLVELHPERGARLR